MSKSEIQDNHTLVSLSLPLKVVPSKSQIKVFTQVPPCPTSCDKKAYFIFIYNIYKYFRLYNIKIYYYILNFKRAFIAR